MNKRSSPFIAIIIFWGFVLSACTQSTVQVTPTNELAKLTPLPVITLPPTPTITPTPLPWWLAPRPKNMEFYALLYNPKATPKIPPSSSINLPIWDNEIPNTPIKGDPQLISTSPFDSRPDFRSLLENAGCLVTQREDVECPPESPLTEFACTKISFPIGVFPDLQRNWQLVGTCSFAFEEEFQPRDEYLYRMGCAFRRNAAHIFKQEDKYYLVSTPKDLRTLFGLIKNPEEALTFAQLLTGLEAKNSFEYDDTFLYFQETITGTQVIPVEDGYFMNLFHSQSCLCEPWISSQVMVQVSRVGEITWLEAIPLWMTTGFSCGD